VLEPQAVGAGSNGVQFVAGRRGVRCCGDLRPRLFMGLRSVGSPAPALLIGHADVRLFSHTKRLLPSTAIHRVSKSIISTSFPSPLSLR
jgi:hypothetical protein